MSVVAVPKDLVAKYQKLAASEIPKQTNELLRRGFEVARDDPGRAMLHVLQPYLKGDTSMLHISYGYGSLDLVDDGDGLLRMDIPDKYLASNLPPEWGTVQPPAARELPREARAAFFVDLTQALASVTLFAGEDRTRDHVSLMVGACSTIPGANPTQSDFSRLKATRAQIVAQAKTAHPLDLFDVADRIGQQLDDSAKLRVVRALHAAALDNLFGIDAVEPFLTAICIAMGVEWRQPGANFTVDPTATLKRSAYRAQFGTRGTNRAASRAASEPDQKPRSFWSKIFGN
jgi:hypothetical protein